jgi:hypothetical protein
MADVMKDKVWNVPGQGAKKREDWPDHVFLDPKGRRYPYKKYSGGQWKISCAGLLAAYRRAIMNKDTAIEAKARKIAEDNKCPWATEEK